MFFVSALPFRLAPVLLLTAIFFLNFTARVILAPLLPVVEAELHLDHAAAGSLFLFIQVGYAAGLLSSGVVASRLGYRRTIALSAFGVGGALLLLAHAGSLLRIQASLIAVGAAAGLYLPAGVATLMELVEQRHWGKALAIHEIAPNLAYVTAPLTAELVLRFLPWRGVLIVLAIAAVALAGTFAAVGRGGARAVQLPRITTLLRTLGRREAWIVGAMFAVGIGVSLGIYTVATLFLVSELGWTRPAANLFVGGSRLLGLAFIVLAGALVDRWGPRRALVLAQLVSGSLVLLLGVVPEPRLTLVLLLLQSAWVVCFFPAGFALIAVLFPPELRSFGVSIAGTTGTLVGAGGVPALIGLLADVASFRLAFVLIGLVALASPLVLRFGRQPTA